MLERGGDCADDDAELSESEVLEQYPLANLDPTQLAFAERVLKWVEDVIVVYKRVRKRGTWEPVPLLRSWLAGSAGSGKSTTIKTIVQHARLSFQREKVQAKIQLTAYTGIAAFNIGFGARTVSSAFRVFPNAPWSKELTGEEFQKLEDTWANVELLIIDEISFIGAALFARMHFRSQQGRRRLFSEAAVDPNAYTFGNMSMLLVGDFGQLEPIDDWSLVDMEAQYASCPPKLRHLWGHRRHGAALMRTFKEAWILSKIHRSSEDMWWTESCLRLRDFTCTKQGDYDVWRLHDLKHDACHFDDQQKAYFETQAVWLCARCEDVGRRNGRKLAQAAEDEKILIHQIAAHHSHKSARKQSSAAFDGLRRVINLVRGGKVILTRNVAYVYGLANGTRGRLVGVVYGKEGIGSMPEALICDFPDYSGPEFYAGCPTWVPILPRTSMKNKTRLLRTQFPLVAGYALTVNKAQGLTIREGVVIHLAGSRRYRPASKHGLPFVAFTRSESFARTAFYNLPPWEDFVKGRTSDMLRMRQLFMERLGKLHLETLGKYTNMVSWDDKQKCWDTQGEKAEHARWATEKSSSQEHSATCAACAALQRQKTSSH